MPGDVGHDARWDLGGVGQERTQESHRAELHGEPETVVVSSVPVDQEPVCVVEMEVATELGCRRLAGVAAVAALLLLRQEVDGHARSPSRNLFFSLGIECQIGSRARGIREPGKIIGFPEPIPGDKMGRPQLARGEVPTRGGPPERSALGGISMIACYCRVSSARQKTDSQKPEIRRWLQANGIDPSTAAWFEDKETGRTLKRSAFDRLQTGYLRGDRQDGGGLEAGPTLPSPA